LFFVGQQFLKDNDINGLAAYGGLLGCAFGFRLFVDWLAAPRTGAIADATGEILRGLVSTAEGDQLAALRFYTTPEWRVARLTVIQRDGRVCKMCSERIVLSRDVSVDHIRPRSRYPELALELTNLQVLCRRCNSSKGARV
jgi:HNH endonuclease